MINAYVDQEVFALVPASSIGQEENTIELFYDVSQLNNFLMAYSEEELEDMRVLHGVLTSAKVIPKEFRGVFPYILVENTLDPGHGYVVESDADIPQELTKQLENIIEELDKQSSILEYDIDDIFILYGYELTLQSNAYNNGKMCIEEYDVNDIQIKESLVIAEEIIGLKKKHTKFFKKGEADEMFC